MGKYTVIILVILERFVDLLYAHSLNHTDPSVLVITAFPDSTHTNLIMYIQLGATAVNPNVIYFTLGIDLTLAILPLGFQINLRSTHVISIHFRLSTSGSKCLYSVR
jgi:hypothetical protein